MQRVLGQLAELGQSARLSRPQVLDQIIAPLHEAVTRVHLEHHRAFVAAQRALPRRSQDDAWVSAVGIALTPEGLADIVDGVREAVTAQSAEHETIRHKIRADAGDLLRHMNGASEKRYVLSILHYFLGESYIAPAPDIMDTMVQEIEQRGGLRAVHPSVSRLMMQLEAATDADHIRVALQEAIADLNEGYTEVCAWHALLRRDVLNEGKTERRGT